MKSIYAVIWLLCAAGALTCALLSVFLLFTDLDSLRIAITVLMNLFAIGCVITNHLIG